MTPDRIDRPARVGEPSSHGRGPARRPRRRVQWWTVAWLALVWVLLWGDLSVPNVLAGVLVALLVCLALPMAPIAAHGRVHPVWLARLLAALAVDLVRASFQVAALALRFGHTPRGAVVRVRLRSHSDLYLTLTAELCSLVPGSLVVEAHRLTGTLYVHVLDVRHAGGVEAARAAVLDQEARVLRALAADDELAAAGLTRSARTAATGPTAAGVDAARPGGPAHPQPGGEES